MAAYSRSHPYIPTQSVFTAIASSILRHVFVRNPFAPPFSFSWPETSHSPHTVRRRCRCSIIYVLIVKLYCTLPSQPNQIGSRRSITPSCSRVPTGQNERRRNSTVPLVISIRSNGRRLRRHWGGGLIKEPLSIFDAIGKYTYLL